MNLPDGYQIAPLPDELRQRAVAHLHAELPEEFFDGVRDAHTKDPEHWWTLWHMGQGMSIRNLLREEIRDDELPANVWAGEQMDVGNWDDYYIEVVEEAAGLRGRLEVSETETDLPPKFGLGPLKDWFLGQLVRRR